MEKWKTTNRFPTFPHDASDDDSCLLLNKTPNSRKEVGRCAASPSGSFSGSSCIGNTTSFQDHPWIGKCYSCLLLNKTPNSRKEVGRCAASPSGSFSGSSCIGNTTSFQDHPWIGKCLRARRLKYTRWMRC